MLLATRARKTAVIQAVCCRPDLTLEQMDILLDGRYGACLSKITLLELRQAKARPMIEVRPGESVEAAVLRVFRQDPTRELSAGFFVRFMWLKRWEAQALLADLATRGKLVRMGKTSSTRYGLPPPR